MSRIRRLALLLVAVSVACGGSTGDKIVVSAASSLTDAFGAVEVAFEAAHPGIDVVLNFGASSTLREQIAEGAPVDVFAAALPSEIEAIAGLLGEAKTFAINELVIAVAPGNPGDVRTLDDFERDELLLGVCVAAAPCGALAREAFAAVDVEPSIDSEEPNVRALLTKVAGGELDAGIVYVTDLIGGGEGLPLLFGPTAEYPIAAVHNGPNPVGAASFVAFVLSDEGRSILAEYGFGSP
jgi:molybdate transport system substrate-binding protein